MSIKAKVFVLIGSNLILFLLTIAVYFSSAESKFHMEEERRTIILLHDSFQEEMAANNRMAMMPLKSAKEKFEKSVAETVKAFQKLDTIRYLTSINPEVQKALEGIRGLNELHTSATEVMGLSVQTVFKDSVDLFSDTNDVSAFRMFSQATSPDASALVVASKFRTGQLMQSIMRFNNVLDKSMELLDNQFLIIETEIEKVNQQSNTVLLVLFILVVGIIIAAASFIALSISRAFHKNSLTVKHIATGDFTLSFDTTRKDEFARLGKDLNTLISNLNISLGKIQNASHANRSAKDRLIRSVESATASAIEIEANTALIRDRMIDLDKRVLQNTNEAHQISGSVLEFQRLLTLQSGQVEHSVQLVLQLLETIKTVDAHATQERRAAETMVTYHERSKMVLDGTFEALEGITGSISSIKDIAQVIAGISAQTNLLAMNAAIEAAHAGEYGRGFAVVASEISTLATASASSSKEISKSIKTVISKIQHAAETRQQANDAMQSMNTQVQAMYASSGAIFKAVTTMEGSSQEIMTDMKQLQDSAGDVSKQFATIQKGSARMKESVGELERISNEVVSNIGEISQGLLEISRSIHAVSQDAENLETISADLEKSTGMFTTRSL